MRIPKKVEERFSASVPKFKRVLKKALDKDVNESDTVSIVTDILAEVFGYDKYDEVTSEYQIKHLFCDLAIKINKKVRFLIEVKAIGIGLKNNHLDQALTYGAKEGIDWIILTNGVMWDVYKVSMGQNLAAVPLCSINFLDLSMRDEEHKNSLFILCKEGLSTDAITEFHEKVNLVNKYTISAILSNESLVNAIRLQLRKLSSGLKITNEEVSEILMEEVIKRDILDDDQFKKAKTKVKRANNK